MQERGNFRFNRHSLGHSCREKASCLMGSNKLRYYVENGGKLLKDRYILLPVRRSNGKSPLGSFLQHLGILRRSVMSTLDPIGDIIDRLVKSKPDVMDAPPIFFLLLYVMVSR